MNDQFVLGLNAYHGDSAAALIQNGRVIAAAEEERFTRVKHWAGMPINAAQYCLKSAGIDLTDIHTVACNTDNNVHRLKKFSYAVRSKPSVSLVREKIRTRSSRRSILDDLGTQLGVRTDGIRLVSVEHHLAHLASTFYPSAFDSAALLSVDGFGDFSSGVTGSGKKNAIVLDRYVHFPHSLGIFYQAITQYLGFPNYGDEYKVMGLASYGEPAYLKELEQVLNILDSGGYELCLSYFRHHKESVYSTSDAGVPEFDLLFNQNLERLLGPRRLSEPVDQRHRNIAASAQCLYENALFSLLNALHKKTGETNLAIAGGCAMNSVANGKIISKTPFERVYVQPAGGDAGGAIGAALMSWFQDGGTNPGKIMETAYLGPEFVDSEIAQVVGGEEQLNDQAFSVNTFAQNELIETLVEHLIDGAVVGWFQGRMEWGARALGNRSILADPRRNDMQELLNSKIKRRESFRPFAPSILEEQVSNWFETSDVVPFMEKVYPFKEAVKEQVPAVVHIDGTGRLQSVRRNHNPKYYDLISEFHRATGVPILLNTSFNENEPVVCTPRQALDCFLRTNMDVLVLNNTMIIRKPN